MKRIKRYLKGRRFWKQLIDNICIISDVTVGRVHFSHVSQEMTSLAPSCDDYGSIVEAMRLVVTLAGHMGRVFSASGSVGRLALHSASELSGLLGHCKVVDGLSEERATVIDVYEGNFDIRGVIERWSATVLGQDLFSEGECKERDNLKVN
ncbi:unnamed protein product [Protopolystoma xenopodis]|uniref:Uncharacterized protein n=1 Tax=Protopolystoma xenopodis TaxID=117903 RepID=A0A3S5B1H6_9PLAT|nr:unnamed protein product [Protopolystoma xenopodis]